MTKRLISTVLAAVLVLAMVTVAIISVSADLTDLSTVAAGNSVSIQGDKAGTGTYSVTVGDEITYTYYVKAPVAIEDIQGTLTYDAEKLQLVSGQKSADMYPVLRAVTSVVSNTDLPGMIKFNATEPVDAGFDFLAEGIVITVKFTVIAAGDSDINVNLEEMTSFGGPSLVSGSKVVNDALATGAELSVPEQPSTPAETEPKETEPKETEPKETEPKVTEPKETEPKVTEPKETEPKVTEPKVTEPKTTDSGANQPMPTATNKPIATEARPTASPDPTGATGTAAASTDTPVKTGAAGYIYIALALIAMTGCSVVALRKNAED